MFCFLFVLIYLIYFKLLIFNIIVCFEMDFLTLRVGGFGAPAPLACVTFFFVLQRKK